MGRFTPRIILFATVVCGGALIAPAFALKGDLKEITLQRTPCFGRCPVYTLTLRADGTATYEGKAHVDRIGTYRGKFQGYQLQRVKRFLAKWNVEKWKSSYISGAADQSGQVVTLVTSEGTKTIKENGTSGPEELWALQSLIDGVGANVRWEKLD